MTLNTCVVTVITRWTNEWSEALGHIYGWKKFIPKKKKKSCLTNYISQIYVMPS